MKRFGKLPSFMRIKELKKYFADGKFHIISVDGKVAGFYVLDGKQFKNLFIKPEFRSHGLATKIIKAHMVDGITICTTRRSCRIKRLIQKLGFHFTGKVVDGKQSKLEIWGC